MYILCYVVCKPSTSHAYTKTLHAVPYKCQSVLFIYFYSSSECTLEAVLSEHALSLNIADDIDERQKIPVRRKQIWSDTKRALGRSGFLDTKGLSVTFIGEPAVDGGRPLCEFFRLLMLGIKNDASLFCGSENEKSLTHNVLALQRKEYYYVGKCIAMSLSYGGPGPHFFCETITCVKSQLLLRYQICPTMR